MALKQPESVDECIYFTNRTFDTGKAMAWVYRKMCPKCGKGRKIDKKADHYVCYACGYKEDAKQMEELLHIEVAYTCPYCGKDGEATTEYKRKVWMGVPSYVFECKSCGKSIGLTKKLKAKKGGDD